MTSRLASILLALSFALAACAGGAAAPATTPVDQAAAPAEEPAAPVAAGPTCDEVGVSARSHFAMDLDPDGVEQAAAVIVQSCNEDRWSEEARRCVVEASPDETEHCVSLLPADVVERLDARMDEILDGGG